VKSSVQRVQPVSAFHTFARARDVYKGKFCCTRCRLESIKKKQRLTEKHAKTAGKAVRAIPGPSPAPSSAHVEAARFG
jgi:hypothetical protein